MLRSRGGRSASLSVEICLFSKHKRARLWLQNWEGQSACSSLQPSFGYERIWESLLDLIYIGRCVHQPFLKDVRTISLHKSPKGGGCSASPKGGCSQIASRFLLKKKHSRRPMSSASPSPRSALRRPPCRSPTAEMETEAAAQEARP